MPDNFDHAIRVFVALFVVMNSLPLLPVVVDMTGTMDARDRRSLLNRALIAGAVVALLLVLSGPLLFDYIGVTLNDLRIAGGVILLVFSVHDLLFSIERRKQELVAKDSEIGVVPLGMPILVGPATVTTLLVLADGYGRNWAAAAFLPNVAINWVLIQNAQNLFDRLGRSFVKSLGKLYSLLLAAIAVSMLRHGIAGILAAHSAAL